MSSKEPSMDEKFKVWHLRVQRNSPSYIARHTDTPLAKVKAILAQPPHPDFEDHPFVRNVQWFYATVSGAKPSVVMMQLPVEGYSADLWRKGTSAINRELKAEFGSRLGSYAESVEETVALRTIANERAVAWRVDVNGDIHRFDPEEISVPPSLHDQLMSAAQELADSISDETVSGAALLRLRKTMEPFIARNFYNPISNVGIVGGEKNDEPITALLCAGRDLIIRPECRHASDGDVATDRDLLRIFKSAWEHLHDGPQANMSMRP